MKTFHRSIHFVASPLMVSSGVILLKCSTRLVQMQTASVAGSYEPYDTGRCGPEGAESVVASPVPCILSTLVPAEQLPVGLVPSAAAVSRAARPRLRGMIEYPHSILDVLQFAQG